MENKTRAHGEERAVGAQRQLGQPPKPVARVPMAKLLLGLVAIAPPACYQSMEQSECASPVLATSCTDESPETRACEASVGRSVEKDGFLFRVEGISGNTVRVLVIDKGACEVVDEKEIGLWRLGTDVDTGRGTYRVAARTLGSIEDENPDVVILVVAKLGNDGPIELGR